MTRLLLCLLFCGCQTQFEHKSRTGEVTRFKTGGDATSLTIRTPDGAVVDIKDLNHTAPTRANWNGGIGGVTAVSTLRALVP